MKPEYWLTYSEEDLLAAKILTNPKYVLIRPAVYHCQQAAEKALKAFICDREPFILKSHDLVRLVEVCAAHDSEFINLLPAAYDLNPYITKSRYPDSFFEIPDITFVYSGIDLAERFFLFVKSKIVALPSDNSYTWLQQ